MILKSLPQKHARCRDTQTQTQTKPQTQAHTHTHTQTQTLTYRHLQTRESPFVRTYVRIIFKCLQAIILITKVNCAHKAAQALRNTIDQLVAP